MDSLATSAAAAGSTNEEARGDVTQVSESSPAAGPSQLSLESILAYSEATVLLNIFQFPFLSKAECDEMAHVLRAHRATHSHGGSMQKYTVDATRLMSSFVKKRIVKEVVPIVNALFDFGKPVEYLLHTAHAVMYSAQDEGEKSLKLHRDDSDITLNITLAATNLAGNEICFVGTLPFGNDSCVQAFEKMRKRLDDGHTPHPVEPPKEGHCLLHRGDHPHSTNAIEQGDRMALIVWLKRRASGNGASAAAASCPAAAPPY